jgi:Spy/CpxP family protein refolding chaperone
MTDTTETPQPAPQPPVPPPGTSRRRFFRPAAIVTVIVIAGLATGIGLKALAYGHGFGGWHRGGFIGGPIDPARLDEHLDRMLRHLYVEVDATDTQKQQLAPIVKAAARDLLPMRERMHDGRRQAVALLSAPAVDRAALEALRASQVQLAEQASRRLTQALADVADVLTPEQRRQLAERAARWHGRRG